MDGVLELTEGTIAVLADITAYSGTAGVRICADKQGGQDVGLSAVLVESPAEEDAVVEQRGARIYLDAKAAAALEDKIIDGYVREGTLHLALFEQ